MTSASIANPLRPQQDPYQAVFMPYGPPLASGQSIEVVESYGTYHAEYAVIRKGVGLLHAPHRGLLRLTGADRQDYLHRTLTQDIRAMKAGSTRRAFLLSDKGRILADLLVHHGDADTWLETDLSDLPVAQKLLQDRLFSEDLAIEDFTPQRVKVALHGPGAAAMLQQLAAAPPAPWTTAGIHQVVTLAGQPVTVYRWDDAGSLGLHLWLPHQTAPALYEKLLALAFADGWQQDDPQGQGKTHIRPIGWLAYNTARIEAGQPLFHVDFGPDSLPHETGILDQAVSFTKGCYLGQEIVARMQNLGHPKRVLVGLQCPDDRLPVAGSQVLDAEGQTIGAVTSSTLSPMRGNIAIAFAVMKWGQHEEGQEVQVPAEGAMVPAKVTPLRQG